MGQLALGIVGGIVGSFFGMPQLGFLAGSLIGGFLFPAKGSSQSGPRLDNLAVTSSSYGQPIFIIYGTVRTSGNIIWSLPLHEVAHKQKSGGKGGPSGGSSTTFTYNWTGAIGICEGPITSILRIWADSKLVYDRTPGSANTKKPDFRFRVYFGDETQTPDPAIEADVGAANATAHRGMAYVVFDDIPLKDYGNRVPSFSFEVVVNIGGASTSGVFGELDLVGGPVGATQNTGVLPDWTRQRGYTFRDNVGSSGIRVYNLAKRKEIRQKLAEDILTNGDTSFSASAFSGAVAIDDDGFIYVQTGTADNSRPIAKIDPYSLVQVGNVGAHSSSLDPANGIITADNMCCVNAYTATGVDRYIVSCTLFNDVQFVHCRTMTYSGYNSVDESQGYAVPGETREGQAVAYVVGHGQFGPAETTPFGIYKFEMPGTAYLTVDAEFANPFIIKTKLGTVAPSDVVSWWSYYSNFRGAFYDTHESRLYFMCDGGRFFTSKTTKLVRYNPETAAVEQVYDITINPNPVNYWRFNRVGNGIIAIVGNDSGATASVQIIDLATGASEVTTGWDYSSSGGQVYDSESGVIIGVGTTLGMTGETNCLIFTGRGAASNTTDGDIVSDLCSRIGLAAEDINVVELDDLVPGYVVNNQMTVRAAIEPLGLAYQFDGVESDDVLVWRKRGQAPSLALTQDDLAFMTEQEGEVLRETRIQEVELPERISVVFLDQTKDYQQNTMTAKRVTNPTPTMYSKNQISHTFPIVLDSDTAKQLADKLLYTSWVERIQEEFHTAWDFLATDPVDSITVTLNNGTVYSVRIIGIDVGANWAMQFKAASEDATTYSSAVISNGGDGFPQQTPPGPTASRTFLMDSPLLRDIDDTGGVASRMYCAAGGFGSTGWPGETLKRSADGSFYLDVATIKTEVSWGAVATALGDTDDPFSTDEINTLNVFMMTGEEDLESITQLEMVNGANAAMILNETTGVVEIVQFRDVTLEVDGSYTLSGLLRGRRGTDVYVGSHSVGEVFILLTTTAVESFTLALGEIGLLRYFKGVPYGTFFEDAPLQTLTSIGRDLKPYAPLSQTATDSAGDIDLAWERRTRIGGELRDLTGVVPLAEASEAYSVDIYNGSTIVRTLTSSTTSVTYASADITTDFGGPITAIKIAVYQMSEAVGRGFTEIVTIPVE